MALTFTFLAAKEPFFEKKNFWNTGHRTSQVITFCMGIYKKQGIVVSTREGPGSSVALNLSEIIVLSSHSLYIIS